MKLRDKDTKKYLLTVFVATFVAYIIPAVGLVLGIFYGHYAYDLYFLV